MASTFFRSAFRRDPRWYQIAALSGLLLYGLAFLHFDTSWSRVAINFAAVLVTQWGCTWICNAVSRKRDGKTAAALPFEPKSALISGLSLCLLLRTNSIPLAVVASVATIAGKFFIRINGKHIFNPTNFGICVMMLAAGPHVWVSPGQWGSVAFFAFLIACLGCVVVNRAARSDVTFAFLGFYIALQIGRALWLGDPLAIPLHRLQNGALLLFAFFMISDPKTTPDSRAGRILFAALVACGAWWWQFKMFHTNGLLWALFACALLVPFLDFLLRGRRHHWLPAPNPIPAVPNLQPLKS